MEPQTTTVVDRQQPSLSQEHDEETEQPSNQKESQ